MNDTVVEAPEGEVLEFEDDFVYEDEDYSEFDCMDCNLNTLFNNEYYMINHSLWDSITVETKGNGMLCIGCVEVRIGRSLTGADFTDAPINQVGFYNKSDRLLNRIMS